MPTLDEMLVAAQKRFDALTPVLNNLRVLIDLTSGSTGTTRTFLCEVD